MHGQGDLSGAHVAYDEALKIDPNNPQAKSGLKSIQSAMENEQSNNDPMKTFYNAFKDPNLLQKLASNPKTSHLLANSDFIAKLQKIQSNPQGLSPGDLQDPNILAVFGALMGIDMSFQERPAGSSEGMPQDTEMPDLEPPKSAPPPKETKPAPELDPEDEERAEKKRNKAKADAEKELGTKSYKKREFDDAIKHYSKAWEIYKDITYLNNLAAVYFEQGDLDEVIEVGTEAVKEGKEHFAEFKAMAK
jgi:stress-induced-phosphoprotein 1